MLRIQQLGNGLRSLNLLEAALESYDRAIALKSKYADAFNNRGVVLWALNRSDEALSSYSQAITFIPSYLAARRNRGNALWELKSLRGACRF